MNLFLVMQAEKEEQALQEREGDSFLACGDCPGTLPGATGSRTPDGCLFKASATGLRLTELRDM